MFCSRTFVPTGSFSAWRWMSSKAKFPLTQILNAIRMQSLLKSSHGESWLEGCMSFKPDKLYFQSTDPSKHGSGIMPLCLSVLSSFRGSRKTALMPVPTPPPHFHTWLPTPPHLSGIRAKPQKWVTCFEAVSLFPFTLRKVYICKWAVWKLFSVCLAIFEFWCMV